MSATSTVRPSAQPPHKRAYRPINMGRVVATEAAPGAQDVFDGAFFYGRPARSDAYKAGVLHCLRVRLDGTPHTPCPYTQGSAEFDAYHAGIAEGRALSPVGGAA